MRRDHPPPPKNKKTTDKQSLARPASGQGALRGGAGRGRPWCSCPEALTAAPSTRPDVRAPASFSRAFKGRSGQAGPELLSAGLRGARAHLPAAASPHAPGSLRLPSVRPCIRPCVRPCSLQQVPRGSSTSASKPPAPRASHMEGGGGGGSAPAEALEAGEAPPGRLPPGPEVAAGPAEPESAGDSAGGEAEGGRGPRRALRAVYVRSESSQGAAAGGGPEAGALKCLLRACEAEGAHLTSVPFGELDFGETAVLDAFYDAGEGGGPPLGSHRLLTNPATPPLSPRGSLLQSPFHPPIVDAQDQCLPPGWGRSSKEPLDR